MRVLLTALLISLLTPVSQIRAQGIGNELAPVGDSSISYRFENPAFILSTIEMRLGHNGEGTLNFTRKGLAQPVERPVRVAEQTVHRIHDLVDGAAFFTSQADYQSTKHQFANMGTIWITANRTATSRTVSFNYTENPQMWELAALLRGIANREVHAFDLEVSIRHAPLALPGILGQIETDLKYNRISEPAGLLPLLSQLFEDPTLPLIARNRAEKLRKSIESGRKHN